MMDNFNIIIMAGGLGKRMNSSLPKVLHLLNNKPLLPTFKLWKLYRRPPGYVPGSCCPPWSLYSQHLEHDNLHYFLNEVHKVDDKCKDRVNEKFRGDLPSEWETYINSD